MIIKIESFLIKAFLFFIPFSYALTFRIGFPLKLSEIFLMSLIVFYLVRGVVKVRLYKNTSFKILLLFIAAIFFSLIINLFWIYDYPLREYASRFGYTFDSIIKYLYVLLGFIVFVISSNAFVENKNMYLQYLFWGATTASIYAWYLFASGVLKIPPILLPGMDSSPQRIIISIGEIVRCGTFKEGNIMGLFLLSISAIAFQFEKKKLGYFYLCTILTTFSSIAIVLAVFFVLIYNVKIVFIKKKLIPILVITILIATTIGSILNNENFKTLIVSKFTNNDNKITNVGSYSRLDRLNSAFTGINMFSSNPFFGVGISNYSQHYDHFLYDSRFKALNAKTIPNNIYVEISCESGIAAILFLILFIISLYTKSGKKYSTLRLGLTVILLYFVAFPTFTVLFLWVFYGLLASTNSAVDKKYVFLKNKT